VKALATIFTDLPISVPNKEIQYLAWKSQTWRNGTWKDLT
jgi:hypothetical protein